MTRVLVCGGRGYDDKKTLWRALNLLKPSRIIHGGASGADDLAGEYAIEKDLSESMFPARWSDHGAQAGPIRNQRMLDKAKPNLVVAFPGGKGTEDMVSRARKAGVLVLRVEP